MHSKRNTISPRELEIVLRKLETSRKECKHHARVYLEHDGKIICATHYSFGRDDIYGRVLRNIIRDLLMVDEVFFGMIDCYLGKSDYLSNLKARKLL